MTIFRKMSGSKGRCTLLSFGNHSWIGTPFGSPSDYLIPLKGEKQAKNRKKEDLSSVFRDEFRVG
ncbi:MAG: hypothetical protein MI802_04810 [Desulfobacterales bacterium]|nr:hypothetical protein [Desulfobacterales bacterium]